MWYPWLSCVLYPWLSPVCVGVLDGGGCQGATYVLCPVCVGMLNGGGCQGASYVLCVLEYCMVEGARELHMSCLCRSTGWWRVPGSYMCPVCVGVLDGGGCQGAAYVLCV